MALGIGGAGQSIAARYSREVCEEAGVDLSNARAACADSNDMSVPTLVP
jgi:hypothetical protein